MIKDSIPRFRSVNLTSRVTHAHCYWSESLFHPHSRHSPTCSSACETTVFSAALPVFKKNKSYVDRLTVWRVLEKLLTRAFGVMCLMCLNKSSKGKKNKTKHGFCWTTKYFFFFLLRYSHRPFVCSKLF